MEEEVWKDVVGYEGLYEVSNTGLVRGVDRLIFNHGSNSFHKRSGRIMARFIMSGYYAVSISKGNKYKATFVHRIVASAFIPNIEGKEQVNHKDFNRLNNNVENLEWVTIQENLEHRDLHGHNAWKGKFGYDHNCGKEVEQLDENLNVINVFGSINDAGRKTSIHTSSISRTCHGGTETAGGFRWRFK